MVDQLNLLYPRGDVEVTYVPKFTREECTFQYKTSESTHRGFRSYGDEPTYYSHEITILNLRISPQSKTYPPGERSVLESVIAILRAWFADKTNETRHPEVWRYLKTNANQISADIRYYLMKDLEIEVKTKQDLLDRMRRRLNIDRTEVNGAKLLSVADRRRLWVEFGGDLDQIG